MKKIAFALTLICLFFRVTAQNQKIIDSLELVLKTAKEDTFKIKTLLALANELKSNDPDNSIEFAKQALELSTELNYKKGIGKADIQTGIALINLGAYKESQKYLSRGLEISKSINDGQTAANAYNNIGLVYGNQGNYAEAMKNFSEVLKIQEVIKDKKEIADCHSNIGVIFEKQAKYKEAMESQTIAINLRKEIGDKEGIAASLNFIGLVHRRQGEYAEAMKNHLSALKILEETGDKPGMAYAYHDMGMMYFLQGNLRESMNNSLIALRLYKEIKNKRGIADSYGSIGILKYYQGNFEESVENISTALKIFTEIGDKQDVGVYYNNIGFLYKEKGNYAEALKNLTLAVKISEEIGDKTNLAETYESLGETYLAMNKFSAAISVLNKAIKAATEINANRITKECYSAMSGTYEKLNDYKNAYKYHKLYSGIKKIIDEEDSRKIAEMKTNFETEKRDKEIQLLNKDKKLKEQESKQQSIIKNIFIVSFFVALLIAGLFFSRNRLRQRSNKIITRAYNDLKKAQAQLVQSEKMASLGQLTAGIAHEINNPINFVSANVNPLKRNFAELVDLIKNKKALNADELNYTINETHQLLTGIEEGSRRTAEIVKGLRNFSRLDEEDMKKANVNEGILSTLILLKSKLKQKNIEVINSFDDLPETECYPGQLNQVFMNLITNAIDSIGQDGKILISTLKENNQIKISIRDTGKGMSDEIKQKIFDPFFTTKDIGKGTGLGLSISYGIIEKHHGKIEVKSKMGEGSEFVITLPV